MIKAGRRTVNASFMDYFAHILFIALRLTHQATHLYFGQRMFEIANAEQGRVA